MWIILVKKTDDSPPKVFHPTRLETFNTKDDADVRIADFTNTSLDAMGEYILFALGNDDP